MKKRIFAGLILMAVLLTIPAYATYQRATRIVPSISFSGTTATCSVLITGDNLSDEISATITLKQGTSTIASWSENATGYLNFKGTASATAGKTYTLTVAANVNGTALSTVSVYGTYD